MTDVSWTDIIAECGNYKEGFVATFRKYEGQLTDEKDTRGRPIPVTAPSFARHMGINESVFRKWVKSSVEGHSPAPRPVSWQTRDVTRTATQTPDAVVKGIMAAPPEAQERIMVEMLRNNPDVAAAIVDDRDSGLAVLKAQGAQARRTGSGHQHRTEPMEPFARALVTLNLLALRQTAEAMEKVAVRDFTGSYVWRPQEKEKVLAELDHVAQILANVRDVLTTEVSDADLAAFLKS